MDKQDADNLIKAAIKTLKVPHYMVEDAYQVGWVSYLEGDKIREGIKGWLRTEAKYHKHEKIFDPQWVEEDFGGYGGALDFATQIMDYNAPENY